MVFIFSILLLSILFPNLNNCLVDSINDTRSIYSIGDTLSQDDQNLLFPVCNGSGDYSSGDFFSFADMNGDLNGGDYKITIISMNATW
tara:strand:- start:274 stop:537 length:264 start_codon:yes stop_codon:yes gene_type:complete